MDWVAPLVDYGKDKDLLFQSLYDKYDSVISNILNNVGEIHITFDTIRVSSGAIFITGHDNGQFQSIRDEFMDKIDLAPGTKRPPSIIHATIARFVQEIDLTIVQQFASNQGINFTQHIESFRLVNEKKDTDVEIRYCKRIRFDKSMTIDDLDVALHQSWIPRTDVELTELFSTGESSIGQCAVTALVVQDYFGGDILNAIVTYPDNPAVSSSHYFNVIDGKEIDLTKQQFKDGVQFSKATTKIQGFNSLREYILSFPSTANRYKSLKTNVAILFVTK
jgi:hypothetical protein